MRLQRLKPSCTKAGLTDRKKPEAPVWLSGFFVTGVAFPGLGRAVSIFAKKKPDVVGVSTGFFVFKPLAGHVFVPVGALLIGQGVCDVIEMRFHCVAGGGGVALL